MTQYWCATQPGRSLVELVERGGCCRREPPLLSAFVAPDRSGTHCQCRCPVLRDHDRIVQGPVASCTAPASASPQQPASSLAPPPEWQAAADCGAHEGAGPAAAIAALPVFRSDPNLSGHDGGMSTDGESPEGPGWKATASPKAAAMPEKRGSAQASSGSWVSFDWARAGALELWPFLGEPGSLKSCLS